jgi:hypothetical protein
MKKGKQKYIYVSNSMLKSKALASLSPHACKLFLDLAAKNWTYNNGDMNMVWPEMKARGWKSPTTLYNARDELAEKGFLITTRQGHSNRCSLYAFTFQDVGEFGGNKLDFHEGANATNAWKKWTQ